MGITNFLVSGRRFRSLKLSSLNFCTLGIHAVSRSEVVTSIKIATKIRSLFNGKSLHGLVVKSGFLPETIIFNHFLNMYCKMSRLVDAHQLFDEMPERDLVSYSAIISGYSQSPAPRLPLSCIKELQSRAFSPNDFILSSLIRICSKNKLIKQGKQIHTQVIILNFESDKFVKTSLIDMYSNFGDIETSMTVFYSCSISDLVTYNSMMSALIKFEHFEEAIELFTKAQSCFDSRLEDTTFQNAIKACAIIGRRVGVQIHGLTTKVGFDINIFVGTSLIDMYGKFADMESAEKIFSKLSAVDLTLYNALIVGFSQNSLHQKALYYFDELTSEGFNPDAFTVSSVLKSCGGLECQHLGEVLHGLVVRSEFQKDLVVNTSLIDMYMKCGSVKEGRQVFDKLTKKHTALYNSMISGYGKSGNFDEAMKIFNDMNNQKMEPNSITFVGLLNPRSGHESFVYPHAVKRGFGGEPMIQNALLDCLIKREKINEAQQLFDRMCQKNVVSWTTIISGFSQLGIESFHIKALELYKKMLSERINPNGFTLCSALKVCGNLVALENGKCIHGSCLKYGLAHDEYINSSLLDMYAKCGQIEETSKLFNQLSHRDVVAWNSMISALAQHGHGKESMELVKLMEENGAKPNQVTFVSLLSACSHCGLVVEGEKVFNIMKEKYEIKPEMEHYTCMVDLYGRAGMVRKAKEVIDEMPFEPNPLILRVFLSACKLHGEIELAKIAEEYVLCGKGEEDNASMVLMSNIYSQIGMWGDVEKVRNRMRDRGARKDPGMSWVHTERVCQEYL